MGPISAVSLFFFEGIYNSQILTSSSSQHDVFVHVLIVTFVLLGMLRRKLGDLYEFMDLRDSFQQYDQDQDGRLSFSEIEVMFQDAHVDLNIKKGLVHQADINNDGYISFEEYPQLIKELQKVYNCKD